MPTPDGASYTRVGPLSVSEGRVGGIKHQDAKKEQRIGDLHMMQSITRMRENQTRCGCIRGTRGTLGGIMGSEREKEEREMERKRRRRAGPYPCGRWDRKGMGWDGWMQRSDASKDGFPFEGVQCSAVVRIVCQKVRDSSHWSDRTVRAIHSDTVTSIYFIRYILFDRLSISYVGHPWALR